VAKITYVDGVVFFVCPGCGDEHRLSVNPGWKFNMDVNSPTIMPSIKSTSGHFTDGDTTSCWCTFNAEQMTRGLPISGFECHICHSYVRDGKIEFLSDSTHKLAGQTVELLEVT
jgi:hypothetical protein